MKKIAIIGCTGSIGRQTLEVVRANPGRFEVVALAAGRNRAALSALAEEFHPKYTALAQDGAPMPEEAYAESDVVVVAASGFAGLCYALEAVRAGGRVALANKESLVCGGELVLAEAERCGAELIPVDSEHSAIFQALGMRRDAPFSKLILTASGGPFLHHTKKELARVTAAEALRHPTWKMGPKVTVDSATLLNKGYELIEAHHLYGAPYEKLSAIVHPESVVHSIVCFEDGAALAQLGYPDMRVPIQLALTCPERLPCAPQLNFEKLAALHFERLPEEKFPCFGLALAAGKAGGTAPTVLNAAAEVAVGAFLEGGITFPRIAETIEGALSKIPREEAESYEALAAADRRARDCARRLVGVE